MALTDSGRIYVWGLNLHGQVLACESGAEATTIQPCPPAPLGSDFQHLAWIDIG